MNSRDAEELATLLQQVPAWRDLQAELDRLRQRVAALERNADSRRLKWSCPVCGDAILESRVKPQANLQLLGVEQHEAECPTCGHLDDRHVQAAKPA